MFYHSRRPGDVASCYASSTLAERELGFKAEKSLTDMCKFKFLSSKDIVFFLSKEHNMSESKSAGTFIIWKILLMNLSFAMKCLKGKTKDCNADKAFQIIGDQIVTKVLILAFSQGRDMWTWQSKNPHGFSTAENSWSWLHWKLIFFVEMKRFYSNLCPSCLLYLTYNERLF